MKQIKIILPIALSLLVISCDLPYETDIIFKQIFLSSKVWTGGVEIDLQKMKAHEGREKYISFTFDPIKKTLWAWNLSLDYTTVFLADITAGYYDGETETVIRLKSGEQTVGAFAYNNVLLFTYNTKVVELVDLRTGEQQLIDLSDFLGQLDYAIGFDDNSIFCNTGYFSLAEQKYSEYAEELDYPYLMINKQALLAIDEKDNAIIWYEVETGRSQRTKFKKRQIDLKKFCGFYYDGNQLYIAEVSFWSNFNLMSQPPQRVWFKYDLDTGKKIKIRTPTLYANVFGKLERNSVEE